MIIHATITKTGKWYAIEIPALGAHTQASTKALKMVVAVVRFYDMSLYQCLALGRIAPNCLV